MDDLEYQDLCKRQEQLHPDLAEYLMETSIGLMLNHPLVQEPPTVDPHRAAVLNSRYQKKCEDVADAYDKGAWQTFIMLHERPYRLHAFIEIADLLRNKQFWFLLSNVWTDCGNIWQNQADWRELWNDDRAGKKYAMDAKERKAFKRLPNQITVYRGICEGHTVNGMSWTLERETAVWFAQRCNYTGQPILLTGCALKSDAHALLLGRKENEIVLDKCEIIATKRLAATPSEGMTPKAQK